MNNIYKYKVLFLLCALLFASCERRPLIEVGNTHYVRVYIDERLNNATQGFYHEDCATTSTYKSPDVMRIILADPLTGAVSAERFLRNKGKDEKGTYYDGYIIADYGAYRLLAYNYDTETTIVNNGGHIDETKAYTNEIASHLRAQLSSRAHIDNEKIAYEPDHLFAVSDDEIRVPLSNEIDTLTTHSGQELVAQSIVKSYYLQVKVKGIEYASSTVGLLTGLSGGSWLKDAQMDEDDPVTVYFEMSPKSYQAAGIKSTEDEDVVTLYTTFNTFGKIPQMQNKLEITFDFLTTYGASYSETIDITDIFSTPEAQNNQWLLIDHIIEIPAPPPSDNGGGFKPNVDEWNDVNTDIEI